MKSDSLAVSMFQMDARSGQKTPMTAAETLPACLAYAQATKQLNDYRLQNRTVSISMLYEEASKKHSHESVIFNYQHTYTNTLYRTDYKILGTSVLLD